MGCGTAGRIQRKEKGGRREVVGRRGREEDGWGVEEMAELDAGEDLGVGGGEGRVKSGKRCNTPPSENFIGQLHT